MVNCYVDKIESSLPKEIRKMGMIELLSSRKNCNVYRLSNDREYIIKEIQCYKDSDLLSKALKEKNLLERLNKSMTSVVKLDQSIIHQWNDSIKVYLIEDYYKSFVDYLSEKKEITIREAYSIIKQLLYIVSDCAKNGVLHLDIKPSNLYFDQDKLLVGDFDTAELITDLDVKKRRGTQAYMAPEVFRDGECSITSEIYSIGIIAYQLFNKMKMPFVDDSCTYREAVYRRLAGEKLVLDNNILLNQKMASIIEKACSFNQTNRYQNCEEMLGDLESIETDIDMLDMKLYVNCEYLWRMDTTIKDSMKCIGDLTGNDIYCEEMDKT